MRLIAFLQIERGDTYPMVDAFTLDTFTSYFFGNFACIMVDITSNKAEVWKQDYPAEFWKSVILGAFYVVATFLQ